MAHTNGFTLVEVLVAVSIGAALLMATSQIVVDGLREVRIVKHDERLHANALYVIDTLSYWIRQSRSLTQVSDTEFEIQLQDLSTKKVWQNGTVMRIGADPITTVDAEIVYVHFQKVDESMQMAFTFRSTEDPTRTFSGTTTVARRK